MLVIMNFLLAVVLFGGWSFAKSAWSEGKYIKSVGIMLVAILACILLILIKEQIKAANRNSVLGIAF